MEGRTVIFLAFLAAAIVSNVAGHTADALGFTIAALAWNH